MFGIGLPEIIIILVIVLIIFGPKKIPELGKALGKGFSEFRNSLKDIRESMGITPDTKSLSQYLNSLPTQESNTHNSNDISLKKDGYLDDKNK